MIKAFAKVATTLFMSLLLTGCFHIQLHGSVGGGEVTIAPLRSPDNILTTATSALPADLIEQWSRGVWDEWPSLLRLLLVGVTTLDKPLPSLDPAALYVVSASGGEDYDPDNSLSLTEGPVAVQGSWHVIATGQRIVDGNLKVSALTEALYRQQLAVLSTQTDAQIQSRLEASAELVVGDVDKNGSVDYNDVLRWHRSLDGKFLLGELAAVDALSDAITSGQPAAMLDDLAENVLGGQRVEMVFDAGTVLVETYNWESPITAANFLGYVRSGFYDQVLVHRAINNFMIQIGLLSYDGLNEDDRITFSLKPAGASIVNESSNGLSNVRGALAMARTSDPNSASAQFFINQANNEFLDFGSANNPDGYAVFARVLSGMSVVDEIAAERTTSISGVGSDVPSRGVILESVSLL
jgi:peptidyl-prolyl cis-trans isomerase A (cyclophilin A)/peptidyl-prolyl cis-trans isomerase B (cyclophilin B)